MTATNAAARPIAFQIVETEAYYDEDSYWKTGWRALIRATWSCRLYQT